MSPALQQAGRQAGWYLGAEGLIDERGTARHRARHAPKQEVELLLLLARLHADARQPAFGARQLRLALAHVKLRRESALEARPRQLERLAPVSYRRLGDDDLLVEIAQLEVRPSDVAHHGDDHATPAVLGGQKLRFGGLVEAPQAPP
jgi:hypothetical protein